MRPSASQLTAFTMAARARSFTRAAEALGVTQSSVTQNVAKLEAMMGVPLFIRRRGGLELTRAARELLEITSPLRDLEDLAAERVGDFSALEVGELRLVANAPRPAMQIVARFLEAYPGITVEFSLASWALATERMRAQEADVGVISDPPRDDRLFIRKIGEARFAAYVRADDALQGAATLEDLASRRLVLPEDGSLTQKRVLALAAQRGVRLTRLVKTTTFPMVQEAVLHGVGVGVMLEDALHPNAEIRVLPIDGLGAAADTCVVTQKEKLSLRAIKRFIEFA
ncbi:MAG: LysR family transcriptional regulator [Pseudomonadota bacterium]